jgi:glucose-1-phosphate adenylyltransferase
MKRFSSQYDKRTISIILGGGVGSRLYPLTKERSKPAVPIAGKYRLIDIPISNCLNSGLRRLFVLTMFNSASLNRHIKNTYNFDHFSNAFVDVLAAEQSQGSLDWFQGTADAVRQSLRNIKSQSYELALILSGDQLYQMDFSKMLEFHESQKADITIATIPVIAEDATSFGIMKVDSTGNINSFVEKPPMSELSKWTSDLPELYVKQEKHYLASMGIYIFSKKVLLEFLENEEKYVDFGKEIIPKAIEGNEKVCSYAFGNYWTDIGDIRSFFEANIALSQHKPDFNLFDKNHGIYTNPRLLPPSKVYGTTLNKVMLAEGSLIHAKEIKDSVIGIRTYIEEGTIIRSSYLMGNDYYEYTDEMKGTRVGIGPNCYIENAIIDKQARIGAGVRIVGDPSLADVETEEYCIKKGVIVLKKNAHIASGSIIGKPN